MKKNTARKSYPISHVFKKSDQRISRGFALVSMKEIKLWKAALALVFAAGFFVSLVWGAHNKWHISSLARIAGESAAATGLPVTVKYDKTNGSTEALENILGDASIESYAHHLHTYVPNKERAKKLGFKHFRLINVEPNKPDLDTCASFNFAGLKRLNDLLGYAKEFNVPPHIVIGDYQFLPDQLKNDWSSAALWGKYDQCIEGFFKYIIGRNISGVVWEAGNEPDIDGSPDDYGRYLKVYQHVSDVAKKVESETGKKITMGGPAATINNFCAASWNKNPGGWYKRFLADVAANKLKLDFFSFHFYANQASFGGRSAIDQTYANEGCGDSGGFCPCSSFEEVVGFIKNASPGTPIWITEWGATSTVNEAMDDRYCSANSRYCTDDRSVNSNYVGAAAHAALIDAMVKAKVDKASFLMLTNNNEDLSSNSYPALFFTNKNSFEKCKSNGYACWIPEATYYVFEMFSELQKGHLLETSDASSSIGSLAAKKNDGGFSAILWNYDWKRDNMYMAGAETSKEETINFKVTGLVENSAYKVKETLVSEKYGDNYAALAGGATMDEKNMPSKPLEQDLGVITASGGMASLDVTLPPSGVMLLEFSPAAAPMPTCSSINLTAGSSAIAVGGTTVLTATCSGGTTVPEPVNWSQAGGDGSVEFDGTTKNSNTVTGKKSGSVTVTAVAANGATGILSLTVSSTPSPPPPPPTPPKSVTSSGFYSLPTSATNRGWVEINLNIEPAAGKEMEADQINVQTIVSSRDYGWEEI